MDSYILVTSLRTRFLGILITLIGIGLMPGFVAAADINGDNSQTGANSTNTNDVTGTRTINWSVTNTGTATNSIDITANTGDNTITNNTEVGDITTGDINLAINLVNLLNVLMPNTTLTVDVWSIFGDINSDILLDRLDNSLINAQTGATSDNYNTTSQAAIGDMFQFDLNNTEYTYKVIQIDQVKPTNIVFLIISLHTPGQTKESRLSPVGHHSRRLIA